MYKDEALTKIDQKDMATFHSGEQGELEDITKHVELELLKVIRKRPIDVVKLKTPWNQFGTLSETQLFGTEKLLHQVSTFKRSFEKLGQFQRWGDLEDSHGGCSLWMNFTNENKF